MQRPDGAITVGLVVGIGAVDMSFAEAFTGIARALSHDACDDQPVELWLLDPELKVRKRIPWSD